MNKICFFAILIYFSITSCEKIPVLPGVGGGGGGGVVVSSISPGEGEPGSTITISGKGFGKDSTAANVSFSGASAKLLGLTDTSMTVIVPESEAKIADVRVTIKKSSNPAAFPFHYLDVYTAGYVINGNNVYTDSISRRMRVWKNGKKLDLFGSTSDFYTFNGITIDGNDLYLVANSLNGKGEGYLKNDQFTSIFQAHGLVGIVKRDNDIYISGRYANAYNFKYFRSQMPGGFFKNGEFSDNITNWFSPYGILFLGTDTIVYGKVGAQGGYVAYKNNKHFVSFTSVKLTII